MGCEETAGPARGGGGGGGGSRAEARRGLGLRAGVAAPARPLGRRWGGEGRGGWRRDAGRRERGIGTAESRFLPLSAPGGGASDPADGVASNRIAFIQKKKKNCRWEKGEGGGEESGKDQKRAARARARAVRPPLSPSPPGEGDRLRRARAGCRRGAADRRWQPRVTGRCVPFLPGVPEVREAPVPAPQAALPAAGEGGGDADTR